MNNDLNTFLLNQGVSEKLLDEVKKFKDFYDLDTSIENRVPILKYKYYGAKTWEKAISAILDGNHILLSGPKATGKNVLSENLAALFGRPLWTISLNVSSDSSSLIGSDTFRNNEVVLKKGPVYQAAEYGGFAVFDEINMAKNESLSVVYSALDFRRVLDVPGYDKLDLHEATRFIGTMNYGYIGTRELNEALVSRFMIVDVPTIVENDLKTILTENFTLKTEYVDLFTKLFLDLQSKSLNSEISSKSVDLRGLFASIGSMKKGLSIYDSLDMGIVDKSFDAYEKEIVGDVIKTLFSPKLKSEDLFER
ncbi:MAG: MoxR family ATPase [Tissierellia bacterium]|nr:MoxR family ATPase [Tissierellia bacterium]